MLYQLKVRENKTVHPCQDPEQKWWRNPQIHRELEHGNIFNKLLSIHLLVTKCLIDFISSNYDYFLNNVKYFNSNSTVDRVYL